MGRSRWLLLASLLAVLGVVGSSIYRYQRRMPTQAELFAQALEAGKNADKSRNYVLGEIAKAQAKSGYYDSALATALLVTEYQDQRIAEILEIRTQKPDIDGAKRMLYQIPAGETAVLAIRKVALAQASAGDLDGALQTTKGQFVN